MRLPATVLNGRDKEHWQDEWDEAGWEAEEAGSSRLDAFAEFLALKGISPDKKKRSTTESGEGRSAKKMKKQ
ncbi:hypothetical protein FKW77_010372 [Venturia effusa]|uniref:Uncharacterized protein n=1 Tax=Venturia effusa TaxID=50376 RepID=A0A517L6G9_9PEZI|nr:hypothetical protein FKW77_010372 [Venturia effusa]